MISKMKILLTTGLFGVVTINLAIAGVMLESKHLPVESLKWFKTGIGPMQAANAFGNMQKEAHGTFLKMPGGFSSPIHSHTNEYHAVVLSGTIVNSELGETDITMNAGSYWFQVGKHQHVTKCVSTNGCLVFLSQPEFFDFIPAK